MSVPILTDIGAERRKPRPVLAVVEPLVLQGMTQAQIVAALPDLKFVSVQCAVMRARKKHGLKAPIRPDQIWRPLPGEEWRAVPSVPNYRASSLGRMSGPTGTILKLWMDKDGYWAVTIRVGGRKKLQAVHRMVCEAFHGPRPSPQHQVAHNDGVRANCAKDNLRWATCKENHGDRREHGTWPSHENHPHAQITMATARLIRKMHAEQRSLNGKMCAYGLMNRMAAMFGVNRCVIACVVGGKVWKEPTA